MGLVSLVHLGGQVLPGAVGIPEPWSEEREMPLAYSFCQYVVRTGRPFVVPNAHDHPIVATADAVIDLGVISYVGAPLTHDDEPRGAVCGIDHIPRHWTADHVDQLEQIAARCSAELSGRITSERAGG
jgi:GAF domain-containing protein